MVEIEPKWNVKKSSATHTRQPAFVEIEPKWNVKIEENVMDANQV